jgi:helix-turn-helix protein
MEQPAYILSTQYLTTDQAAKEFGIPIATLRHRVWDKSIQSIKLNGKCTLIARGEMERYIRDRR